MTDSLWSRIEATVRQYAGIKSRQEIAEIVGISAMSVAVLCSKHQVSLKIKGKEAGKSRSTIARRREREKHDALDSPVKLNCDVEGLWRPIRHPKLPIEVRQHYYA